MKKNETFCDVSATLCLHGSLSYQPNSRVVRLNARVLKSSGPGVIRISLSGTNRQDFLRQTEIRITIRGSYSEIIDHKMRPDAPDVGEWVLSSFIFESG